jgi:hypothetical protein
MLKENFHNAVRMLEMQLNEEKENYKKAMNKDRSADLEQIEQRMICLKDLLTSLEHGPRIFVNKPKDLSPQLF